MKLNQTFIYGAAAFFAISSLTSCVSKKKFLDSQIALRYSKNDSLRLATQVSNLQNQLANLNTEMDRLKAENSSLAKQGEATQNQLDANKKALFAQQKKANELQALLDLQKEKANALRKKMSDALKGFSSDQLTVTQKDGKVYVSLQESLLFPSGSAQLNQGGIDALGKLAQVLNQNPEINIDVEGHTDSIPIRIKFKDNWELSTERALSIVRVLIDQYQVNPNNLIASGHSEFDPVAPNSTPEGRAKNRRTDIILSPDLSELFKILDN